MLATLLIGIYAGGCLAILISTAVALKDRPDDPDGPTVTEALLLSLGWPFIIFGLL